MRTNNRTDTIAAIATPFGEGGIAVIRVSGDRAVDIVDRLFAGKRPLRDSRARHVIAGSFLTLAGGELDSVLVTVFRRPHSYTGEDVLEISCHGGFYVSRMILESVIGAGARPAGPGEFTERAFLNGKIDLTQAEAVADLIHAKSESARKASLEQLHGRLHNKIVNLRQSLLDLCSLLEIGLDFAEEGLELSTPTDLSLGLRAVRTEIQSLADSFTFGKLVREGVRVVLVGKPNAGKSSLLNLLLNENRAIISDIPGTTRDIIEENVVLSGMLFRLIDTAGLREAFNEIEKEGMRRTAAQIEMADVILLLHDSSLAITDDDAKLYRSVKEAALGSNAQTLFLLNKSDLKIGMAYPERYSPTEWSARISCKSHEGIEEFKNKLVEHVCSVHDSDASSVTIQNVRHRDALRKAGESITLAEESLEHKMSPEFAAVDIHAALDFLGEIIGTATPEDVLINIFSQFCIGK